MSNGHFRTPPSSLTICFHAGKAAVVLTGDGEVKFGEDYNPTEAAVVFWKSIAENNPLLPELRELRARVAKL